MITGFNTDVEHEGVTYHVQTEDKGLDSPLILSLVYIGGTIIASKRTPYQDLVSRGFDEQALIERLQRQHKLICAAIKSGRIEELKRMGGPNGGAAATGAETSSKGESPAGKKPGVHKRRKPESATPHAEPSPSTPAELLVNPPASEAVGASPVEAAAQAAEVAASPRAEEAKSPPSVVAKEPRPKVAAPPAAVPAAAEFVAPAAKAGVRAEPDVVILTTLAEEISALGDMTQRVESKPHAPQTETPPAVPGVTPAGDAESVRPILKAEIFETQDESSDELYLTLLDDEGDFRAGQLATVKVYVGRGAYGQRPEGEASVTVKVLGTSFRPLILTTATDALGVGVVRALLPRFSSGRAAIIIRAVAGEDAAEMRRIIHQ